MPSPFAYVSSKYPEFPETETKFNACNSEDKGAFYLLDGMIAPYSAIAVLLGKVARYMPMLQQ
jgi:hypothetical protein